jgi:phosphomannomutase
LRYSGTEPKVRLLIEGPDLDAIEQMANGIAEELQKAIGVHA